MREEGNARVRDRRGQLPVFFAGMSWDDGGAMRSGREAEEKSRRSRSNRRHHVGNDMHCINTFHLHVKLP